VASTVLLHIIDIHSQNESDYMEVLDGTKTVYLEVDVESSNYTLTVFNLTSGYQYNFKVCLICSV